MVVGTLQVELKFHAPQSLKEKRTILKSLVARLRREFNVAVAEIDGMDLWQASTLAVAAVSNEQKRVNQTLNYVSNFISDEHDLEIVNQHMEMF